MTIFNLLRTATLVYLATATFSANSNSYEWELLGPGDADQVTSVSSMKNGDIIIGLDIGGLYRSSNKGDSWEHINHGLNNLDVTTKVIQDAKKTDRLLVGTRGGIYFSNDYGMSWNRTNEGLPAVSTHSISGSIGGITSSPFDDKTIYAALGYRPSSDGTRTVQKQKWSRYIYRSKDEGDTWKRIKAFGSPTKVTHIQHSIHEAGVVYASTNNGLYRGSNYGEQWHKILDIETLSSTQSSKNVMTIYAACGDLGVFKSDDNGVNWKKTLDTNILQKSISKHSDRFSNIISHRNNPDIMYVTNSTWGSSGGIYKSDDAGNSWKLISDNMPESWLSTSRRINDIDIDENGTIFAGSSRYIYSSDDQGAEWKQLISKRTGEGWTHTGINVFGQTRFISHSPLERSQLYIGTADHGLLESKDSGSSWLSVMKSRNDSTFIWDISYCEKKNTTHILTSGNDKELCIMSKTNESTDWTKHCTIDMKASWRDKLYSHNSECSVLMSISRSKLIISHNSGKSWSASKSFPSDIRAYSIHRSKDDNQAFIGTSNGIYRYEILSDKTTHLKSTERKRVTSIFTSQENDDLILFGTEMDRGKMANIYRSIDGGMNWEIVLKGLRKRVSSIISLPADDNIMFASTLDDNYHDVSSGSGIFRSDNKGADWYRIDSSLPVHRAYMLSTSPHNPYAIYLASNGSGAYVLDLKNELELTRNN